jgi:hypothetical protein
VAWSAGAMSRREKLIFRILSGTSDGGIAFSELRALLARLGFVCRVKGDHFIYVKPGVDEILNLQPRGGEAKPYQIRQIRNVILKYRLGDSDDV